MKAFNYQKALAKASKSHKVWNSDKQKYELAPDKFKFALRYYKTRQTFENSTGKCIFNPVTGEAYSYNWWRFVLKVGNKYLFNNSSYSPTTGQHQRTVGNLLGELGIKPIDICAGRKSLTLDSALSYSYQCLCQAEIEQGRKNAKPRTYELKKFKAQVKLLRSLGARCSKAERDRIKMQLTRFENERLQRLGNAAAQRKRIRDRIAYINKSDPAKLSSKEMLTEPNAEIRRMLFARIGGVRILKELNAKTVDKQGSYELVDLDLGDNRRRPYLKMLNPSTGEVHVEGVPPGTVSVEAALAWRNGARLDWNGNAQFIKPLKLT